MRKGEVFLSGRNHVGAAWSASRMVTYEPAHGAEICPLSIITLPFSPLPQMCLGESEHGGICAMKFDKSVEVGPIST
jgi:hypothetical protein